MEKTHQGYTLAEAEEIARKNGETVVPAFCAMCGPNGGCGIYAFCKDGRMTRVGGMAEAGRNRGALCPKAHGSAQWLHSPDRLMTPLVRVGEKGEGKFREISWDEALDILADKLKEQKEKYGPESLAILVPAFRNYNQLLQRFLTVHGSPNYAHSGICMMQRMFAFHYTIGAFPTPDLDHSDLIIYWGRQPVYSGPATSQVHSLVNAKARSAKIVTIKPSMEIDGELGDTWIPVRPGTDAALALAMLHVVIGEKLIDLDFVRDWCYGFEQLREHARQYSPEWAETITGVPAAQIRALAREYATTKAACIDVGNGLEHAPSCCDAIRAIAMLMAVTGHLDRPGCNLLGGGPGAVPGVPSTPPVTLHERYTQEMVDKLVAPEFPKAFQPFLEGTSSAYYKIFESVLTEKPYPIRTIIAAGTQPLVSNRGTRRVVEALKKVEFFVTIDVARTAEMDYADLVLPTATPYESDHPFEAQGPWLMARRKVVEPQGDYRSIHELFLELAVRMGYGADFWDGSIERYENFRLAPFGMTIDELRALPTGKIFPPAGGKPVYEKYERVFSRPSPRLRHDPFLPQGKVALYSTVLEAEGFAPMPVWREPPESLSGTPELAERYPLVLTDYHTTKSFTASWQRNVPALREIQPEPTVQLNPETARVRGIQDGDWVRVESPHGHLCVKAELYPGIRPDTVMLQHGWWQGCRELGKPDLPVLDGGANVNLLYSTDLDRACDPLVTAMSSQTLVEVRKDG